MMMDLCEMHNLKKLKREGDLQYISLKSIFLLQLSFILIDILILI